MAAVETPGVLGTFHGSEEFPIEWQEGERELFWIFDDLHCPNPVSPLFFDIGGWWLTCDHMFRRFGTPFASRLDRQEHQRLRLHRGHPGRPAAAHRGHRVPGALRAPRAPRRRVRRRDRRLPRVRAAPLRRQLPRLVAETRCGRRSSATSPTSTAATTTARRFVELAVLLEDAIDVHDRHWKIHWMLNFAQFASTLALNAAIAEVRGEADPGLLGRLQSRRGPQLGLDRGPVGHEGGGQGRPRAARGLRRADTARRHPRGARGLRARPALRRRAPRARTSRTSATRRSGRTSSRSRPGSRTRRRSSRRSAGTWRRTTTTREHPGRPRRPRGGQGARSSRASRASSATRSRRAGRSLAMNPLTPDHHFYIDQGTNARLRLVVDRDRPQARRGGRARRPRGRRLPALQRGAPAARRPVGLSTPRSSSPTGATTTRRPPSGGRRPGSAPPPRWRSASRTRRCGASPRSSAPASRRRPARSRASPRPPASSRAPRATSLARRVRRGRGRRDPRVPHDQPGLGRAVHQDQRPGDRGRRHGVAPGRRGARVRDPGRRRHRRTPASGSRPATGSG